MAIRVLNRTDFPLGRVTVTIQRPQDALAVIVKGTFALRPDAAATPLPASEQLGIAMETPYPDGPDGSCWYPGDYAPYKPRTDVTLVGTCYPPGGQATGSCEAVLSLGPITKRVAVFGDREWRRSKGTQTIRPSDPAPFTAMPVRYHRALGGADYIRNPIGIGRDNVEGEDGKLRLPLPNIENPTNLMTSMDSEPVPVAFGPLPVSSMYRQQLAGTRDSAWQKRRAPVNPADFDWGFHNAAPADQQIPGFLRGDEAGELRNLHQRHGRLAFRLPGLAPRVVVKRDPAPGAPLQALRLNLDTVWLDPDNDRMVLAWRGLVGLSQGETADGFTLYVDTHPVAEPPGDVEALRPVIEAPPERPKPSAPDASGDVSEALEQMRAAVDGLPVDDAEKDRLKAGSDPAALLAGLAEVAKGLAPDAAKP